jgi:hypothetical protein
MRPVQYRLADKSDIPAMGRIRAAEWETEEYWRVRISRYLNCELHPHQALIPRVSYVALEGEALVGFIAEHLTRRYACDGELEWINVNPKCRRSAIASELLRFWPHGLPSKKHRESAWMLIRPTQQRDGFTSGTAQSI